MALSATRTTCFLLCVLLLADLGHAASFGAAERLLHAAFQPHATANRHRRQILLVHKLPLVSPVDAAAGGAGENVTLFRGDSPQPEACWHCVPGASPQPAESGRASRLVRRVANSKAPVAVRQFPWHATLLDVVDVDQSLYDLHLYCSGSLVSEEWVLTAASCVQGRAAVSLRLGSYTPGMPSRRMVMARSSHIAIHPDFSQTSTASSHDIAAVRLRAPVKFNRYLLPVRLPSTSSFLTTYTDRDAWLSGWAVAGGAGGTLRLKSTPGYAHEKVLSNEECSRTYGLRIEKSHLCTSTARFAERCEGDAGAPLVVAAEDAEDAKYGFVQVGVLSFAVDCTSRRPAAFTRISSHLRWIQNTTGIRPPRTARYSLPD